MDFVSIIMLMAVYFLRPHEWFSLLSTLRPAAVVLAFALVVMVFRARGFSPRSLIKTPHDWLMLAYFGWAIFTADSAGETWGKLKVMLVSYLVMVQALNSLARLQRLLVWWMGFLFVLAALAVASEFGVDPLETFYLSHEVYRGRLTLNLTICDNPNALGHTIVPLILMLYFFCFWRRPIFIKEVGAGLMVLPLYCLYLTESKGAFFSGFVTLILGMMVGRPKVVQIGVLVLALTLGWTGLQMLPRMEQMKTPRADEGIQVRLLAWKVGLDIMQANRPRGIGVDQFPKAFENIHGYPKGAHSTYVQIGAELGQGGLLLFLGIIYCCFHSLLRARTTDADEERLRRILIVTLTSFCVSSWMIGWGMNITFFFTAATIAAFYRLVEEKQTGVAVALAAATPALPPPSSGGGLSPLVDRTGSVPAPLPLPSQLSPGQLGVPAKADVASARAVLQPPMVGDALTGAPNGPARWHVAEPNEHPGVSPTPADPTPDAGAADREPLPKPWKPWLRLRLIDGAAIFGLTWLVLWIWQYILTRL